LRMKCTERLPLAKCRMRRKSRYTTSGHFPRFAFHWLSMIRDLKNTGVALDDQCLPQSTINDRRLTSTSRVSTYGSSVFHR
ncbi:hypothetical protein HAX54_043312, partial [Datura stramonium]|nr:hypothetical protein [Datura stramonium]